MLGKVKCRVPQKSAGLRNQRRASGKVRYACGGRFFVDDFPWESRT